ncbi:MFS transporter [Pseudonocardia halophobica]|uniref:MFS transporter n=1 Tax=Pseudonocardia halophobica TaxID=29401 RepID=A0A9W6P1N8_9PSEU|nr:MFS transporter [Pseudonocardia halophobica]GLL16230.1 MFS transporter [Pseudonocardia halophobica]
MASGTTGETGTTGGAAGGAPAPGRTERRARIAVAAVFLTNGAVFANLLPRYPEIKASLELSNAQLGTAVAAFPFGALLAGLTASTLVRRFRSSRVATFGMVVVAVGILLAGLAPNWGLLAGALFVAGAADAVVDVGQNAHALRVQRRYGRSIFNSFHATWSAGSVLGGLMGSAAAGLALPLGLHLGVSAGIFVTVAMVAYRFLLPGPEDSEREPTASPARVRSRAGGRALLVVLVLGVIASAGALVEDSGASWAAVYLSGSLGAAAAVAGLGFVALQALEFLGRVVGDRLVDRFGQRAVARAGAAIVVVAMGLALAFPTVPGTIVGFGLAGLGVATLIPAAMHAADELPGLPTGAGLTVVSWLLRVGFLVAPPVVGLVADATSLRAGLLVVPLAGLVILAGAQVLPRRRTHAESTKPS